MIAQPPASQIYHLRIYLFFWSKELILILVQYFQVEFNLVLLNFGFVIIMVFGISWFLSGSGEVAKVL